MHHDRYLYAIPKDILTPLTKAAKGFDDLIESMSAQRVPTHAIRQLGIMLFNALNECVEDSMTFKTTDSLTLHIQSEEVAVQKLPWELAFDPNSQTYLSLKPRFQMVRHIEKPEVNPPEALQGPLRILMFIASPEDLDPEKSRLDFEREEQFLLEQLDGHITNQKVEVTPAPDGCLETLAEMVRSEAYHILHISTHGAMTKKGPVILCEDIQTGNRRNVTPKDLLEVLDQAQQTIPLVFLSACQSAMTTMSLDSIQAIPSFTEDLIRGGIPAAIGMRLSVADTAASNFAGHFYKALAEKRGIEEALTLARIEIAASKMNNQEVDSLDLQWTLPVLYHRYANLPLVDEAKPYVPKRSKRQTLITVGKETYNAHTYIGRRREMRKYFRPWEQGKQPHLLLEGLGGMGKTTLAGRFAERFLQSQQNGYFLNIFAPTFDPIVIMNDLGFDSLFNDIASNEELGKVINIEDPFNQLAFKLKVVARKPLVILFDNLEDCLSKPNPRNGYTFKPEHEKLKKLINFVQNLNVGSVRTLLTCRYTPDEEELVRTHCAPVADAPFGDILRFMQLFTWKEELSPKDKREIYKTLGGNFRSIAWLSGLLSKDAKHASHTWKKVNEHLHAEKPNQPSALDEATEHVLQGMRQNILFDELMQSLESSVRTLLQNIALETRSFIDDAFGFFWDESATLEDTCSALTELHLIEEGSISLKGNPFRTFQVPPIVAQFLKKGFPLKDEEAEQAHFKWAKHWQRCGKELSEYVSDYLAAIEHYDAAHEPFKGDVLREELGKHFYARQEYASAIDQLFPIWEKRKKSATWQVLNTMGQAYHSTGKYKEALAVLEASEGRSTSDKDKGATFNNLAANAHAQGDYEKALSYLKRSLKICEEIGDRNGEGTALSNISSIYAAQGDYAKTLVYSEFSLKIQQEIGDHKGVGATLNNLATTAHVQGDYMKALGYLEFSLKIQQEIGDRQGEGTTLSNLAAHAHAQGDYVKAIGYLERSLNIQQEIGDRRGEGTTLNNLATTTNIQGDYVKALCYSERSLKIQQEIGDRQGEGATLNNISLIYKVQGDYVKALGYSERSLKIQQEIGDRQGEGTTLNNLATTAIVQGDYMKALCYLDSSLKIQQEIGDRQGESTTLNNISQIYDAQGDYVKALGYLERSLKICEEIGNRHGEGMTLNNISQIYGAQGDYVKALGYLERSLKICEEIGDRHGEGTTLNNISQIYDAQGDYVKALSYLERSLKICEEIGDRLVEGATLNNMSQILGVQLGNTYEALRLSKRAFRLASGIGYSEGIWAFGNWLIELMRRSGQEPTPEIILPHIKAGITLGKLSPHDFEGIG
jgi:tetratricopeptide (TPR) repeat protein